MSAINAGGRKRWPLSDPDSAEIVSLRSRQPGDGPWKEIEAEAEERILRIAIRVLDKHCGGWTGPLRNDDVVAYLGYVANKLKSEREGIGG